MQLVFAPEDRLAKNGSKNGFGPGHAGMGFGSRREDAGHASGSTGAWQRIGEGLRRGAGFGVAFSISEASVAYLPTALRLHLQTLPDAIVKAVAFNIGFGAVLGLVASPLLAKKHGGALHSLACAALLAVVLYSLTPLFITAIVLTAVVVCMTLALHALALALGPRPGLAKLRIPAAVLLLTIVYVSPRLAVPPPPQLTPARLAPAPGAPNVLLIVVDTVRADHIDLYGYPRHTAPTLARLATEGTLFERAIAAGTWTIPSHASMFTGKYPSAHGAHHESNRLAYENTTLAELFHAHGYATIGFNSNPFMTDSNGFTQGFQRMESAWLMMTAPMNFLAYRIGARTGLIFEDHGAHEVTSRFLHWLDAEWDGRQPFFVFLNYIESHFPYHVMPPRARDFFVEPGLPDSDERHASDAAIGGQLFADPVSEADIRIVRDLYDGGIRYEDGLIARVIDALGDRGTLDHTIVILVSDHGELFGERGLYGHEVSLSEHLLHVPLVIRYPPRVVAGRRIATPVSTAALFGTVLELADIVPPDPAQTASLVPLLEGRAEAVAPVLSEQHRFRGLVPGTYKPQTPFDQIGVRYRALEEGGWKLIVDSRGNEWLYRPREDPEELHDYANEKPDVKARLAASLAEIVGGLGLGDINAETLGPGGNVELDPAAKERLKALGYVH